MTYGSPTTVKIDLPLTSAGANSIFCANDKQTRADFPSWQGIEIW